MSRTIYKYKLDFEPQQYVKMPIGAEILSVHLQNQLLHVWAMVDPSPPIVQREIHIIGTGHKFEPRGVGRFIGTCLLDQGSLVLHVFEGDR